MLQGDGVDVDDLDFVSSDLETLHVGQHRESLSSTDVFANLVVLLQEDLVDDAVAHWGLGASSLRSL